MAFIIHKKYPLQNHPQNFHGVFLFILRGSLLVWVEHLPGDPCKLRWCQTPNSMLSSITITKLNL